jgi:hypothetical protein
MTLSAMGIPRRGRPGAHLVPRRRPDRPGLAAAIPRLPDGAHEGITASLGPVRPEDLLVFPAVAWPLGGWRRRCLYSPLCVAVIGEQGVGLWVQDLPLPEVRAHLALDDIALVEQRTAGPVHALTVTARTGTLVVRCDDDQRSRVDAWTGRLRLRVAARSAPLPPTSPYGKGGDLDAFLLAPDDQAVVVGHRGGRLRRCCLLAVTSRELIIEHSWRDPRRPWRQISRTLYLPQRPRAARRVTGSP